MQRIYDKPEFWSKVDVCHCDDEKGCSLHCWPWIGVQAGNGHGQAKYRLYGAVVQYAHRIAWTIYNRRLPLADHDIGQLCRVRLCCNPAHLYEHPRSKRDCTRVITDKQARELIALYQAGTSQAELARMFGVRSSSIRYILKVKAVRLADEDQAEPA